MFLNPFGKQSFVRCDAANKVSQEGVEDGDEFEYIEEELPSNVSGYIYFQFLKHFIADLERLHWFLILQSSWKTSFFLLLCFVRPRKMLKPKLERIK